MIGKIRNIRQNDQYKFDGQIICADNSTYYFNSRNWIRQDIELSELVDGQEVEFELKPPNRNGRIFPTMIRFSGEVVHPYGVQQAFDAKHRHGEFKKFVFTVTSSLATIFFQLVPDFNMEDPRALYKHLATTYNNLSDADFQFETDGAGFDIALFPSGFTSADGDAILLYCTRNDEPDKAEWLCNRVFCRDRIIGGSVFDLVNASWYDIESDIRELLSELNLSAHEIARKIENRCIDISHAVVALKNGVLASVDNADYLYVPTSFFAATGEELFLRCAKCGGPKGYGWYYNCITYENAPITVYSKKNWLELWADLGNSQLLENLANQTLEEKWSFGNRADFGILKNYLRYTFAHQWEQNCIGFSADRKYAAFNTGLPDRGTYKYLYAFFEAIIPQDSAIIHPLHCAPKYRFRDFVMQGRGGDGKLLSSNIRPLPDPPQYFKARSATVWELDFNSSNQPTLPDYDDAHILIQRCDRLPLDFYQSGARASARLADILSAQDDISEKYKNIRDFFRPIVDRKIAPDIEVTQAYRLLQSALYGVIDIAVKRLSWNWRAVVPCYNPEERKPCFLLPVSFYDNTKPDRALIVSSYEVDDELIYQIHTVIPLDWAYLDARLVCRPESEWLAADCIN